MKKALVLLILFILPTFASAQLTKGKYSIISVKGFMNGKTLYDNFFNDESAIVRVEDNIINIVISGYSVITYSYDGTYKEIDGAYIYNVTEVQTGRETFLMFKKLDEYPEIDGGILILNRSDYYSDVFQISKNEI